MNTQQETIVEEMPDVPQPGLLLKQQREALGLSQQEVADRLRLRVTIIRNIEDNEFDSDLVATFTRGYLRSYAKSVGLPANKVIEAYEFHYVLEPPVQKMKSFSKKTKRDQHDNRIMFITWLIVLIIIGMSSLWWWQNNHLNNSLPTESPVLSSDSASSSSDNSEPILAELPTVTELTSQQQTNGDELLTTQQTANQANDVSSVVSENTTATVNGSATVTQANPNKVEISKSPADDINLLSMSFSADCWIQVKDASGKTLATGVKKAGESINVRGETPLSVILGAPEGVSVTFASEPVDLSGYTAGRVARFTLP